MIASKNFQQLETTLLMEKYLKNRHKRFQIRGHQMLIKIPKLKKFQKRVKNLYNRFCGRVQLKLSDPSWKLARFSGHIDNNS